jgi:hypothetical protein
VDGSFVELVEPALLEQREREYNEVTQSITGRVTSPFSERWRSAVGFYVGLRGHDLVKWLPIEGAIVVDLKNKAHQPVIQ